MPLTALNPLQTPKGVGAQSYTSANLCSSTDSEPMHCFTQELCWQQDSVRCFQPVPAQRADAVPAEQGGYHWDIGMGSPEGLAELNTAIAWAEAFSLPGSVPCQHGLCQVLEPAPGCACFQVSFG